MAKPQPVTPEGITKHIQALVGSNVTARKLTAQEIKGNQVYSLIHDEAGTLVSVILCDIAAAGSTGASLSKIPAGAVQDLIRKNQLLDEDLLGNFHEVANVLTVLTTAALGRRTILRTVSQTKTALDAPILALIKGSKQSVLLQVTVQGYPPGALNMYIGA